MKRSSASLVAEFLGQGKSLSIPRPLLKMLDGDYVATLLLGQIVYWSEGEEEKWFYKTYPEWEEEIGASKYLTNKATTKLKNLGLIHTELKKVQGAPTLHYRLDWQRFLEWLEQIGKSNPFTLESQNPSLSKDSENPSLSIYREETTDIDSGNPEKPSTPLVAEENVLEAPPPASWREDFGRNTDPPPTPSLISDPLTETLEILERVEGYPKDRDKTLPHIARQSLDFPEVDIKSVARDYEEWAAGLHGNRKIKNHLSTLRGFFKRADQWRKENEAKRSSGRRTGRKRIKTWLDDDGNIREEEV